MNKDNRLIADGGSTKTEWRLGDGRFRSRGLNPYHLDDDEILSTLEDVREHFQMTGGSVTFYGSGVTDDMRQRMERLLAQAFPGCEVHAWSDLVGAAMAVCGREAGIACILGTGANSGLWDGNRMIANTPPLGYILGDEGSGAALGKRFLNAAFKGFLPAALRDAYLAETQLTYADVIRKVYREPQANRYLAGIAPFVKAHIGDSGALHDLVIDNFREFFDRNLIQYGNRHRQVGFVGSIAWAFQSQLRQVAEEKGYRVTRIVRSPVDVM